MPVLFIGRFQPLHLGHLSVIAWLRQSNYQEIIVGIGSSEVNGTMDNPLSLAQRRRLWQVIEPQLPLVALPDIHDDNRWVEHIRQLVYTAVPSGFNQIVSRNHWVQRLAAAASIPVLVPPERLPIDGTTIRQLIRNHDDRWKQYVPSQLHQLVSNGITGSDS